MAITLKTFAKYWLPILFYVGLIFVLSSFSSIPFRLPKIENFDKVMHFTEYAILAILLSRAVNSMSQPRSLWLRLLLCVGLVVVFGSLDEIYQSTVPNRQSDIWDLLADSIGGLTGSGLFFLIMGRRGAASEKLQDKGEIKPVPRTLAKP